jgi:hypothetical protein
MKNERFVMAVITAIVLTILALAISLAQPEIIPEVKTKTVGVVINTETITTTTETTTTTSTTTTETTTTTSETTTTVAIIEYINYETETATEVIEEEYEYVPSLTDCMLCELTYYSGPSGCYGASGRTLINGYSCASNYYPLGSIIYIESDYISGYFSVDDTGEMSDNIVDIFYSDYSLTPTDFADAGRVPAEVWMVQ